MITRVWRYERGNQNPYIEEGQTTQWPKEKVQKDKQRSTKHTHKTKDRVTRTPLKTRGELRCPGRVEVLIINATKYSLVQPDSCMIYNTDFDFELLMRPVSTESRNWTCFSAANIKQNMVQVVSTNKTYHGMPKFSAAWEVNIFFILAQNSNLDTAYYPGKKSEYGWLVYGVEHHFQQYSSYIVLVSFIGWGNWSIRRKPQTCGKSLTNFIT